MQIEIKCYKSNGISDIQLLLKREKEILKENPELSKEDIESGLCQGGGFVFFYKGKQELHDTRKK
jgi:hypothetical protein